MPQGQVKALGGEGHQTVAHIQLEADPRIALHESRQSPHQLLAGKGHRRGDAQSACGNNRQRLHIFETTGNLCKGFAGIFHQPPAGVGEAHRSGGAKHQRHTRGLFELADSLADG
jgi:hypothetical protein